MRLSDWQSRLRLALSSAEVRTFTYGACVALAAECVDAVTGNHFRADVEPLIAAARNHPVELDELSAFVTERLGAPLADAALASPGDVALLQLPTAPGSGNGPALAVCTGDFVACAGFPSGVTYLRKQRALRAWRVS